ncbi:hypothetical protein C5167_010349 [Papaver somniferum]|uniref:Uncharacterized protein n=1 Tax=Papaver somniferum TaxID=3469 RepID=A0A4Y7K2V0_PAPSO|nr:DNA ligase 1-like [Papaver somniferum]RZC66660.1 hypothetical protein C5167_010349 [Papaver somniferum]
MPAVEKKKPVKKEEEIDEKISTLGNKKKRLSLDNAKTRVTDNKDSTVAKVEPKDENIEDDEYVEETKDSIRKTVTKTTEEKRRKKSTVVTDEKKKKRIVVKTEKKVYDFPGQKRDPPEERDPSRIFYESLYEQRPDSEMAKLWMMECGLLPVDEAKQVFEQKHKNQAQRKIIMSSPIKAASVTKSANSTVKRTTTTTSTKTTTATSSSAKKKPAPEPKTTPKQSASKKRKVDDRSSDDDDSDFEETISNRMTKKRLK